MKSELLRAPHPHLLPRAATRPMINGAAKVPEGDRASILLVDDRADKMLALEAVLSSLNQNLVKATSGKEALRLLLKQDFAVILLDVSMPVMDGFETAKMIRQRDSSEHTPIIFVTSYSNSENEIARGYSLGAVDYILTPIVPNVLKSKVSVFVELYRKTAEVKRQAEQLRRIEEVEHQRKLNEAAERLNTETKRNRFFTLAVDMLAIASFEGYFLQANPAWEQTLGFSAAELKARPGLDFAHPANRAAMAAELERLQQGAATTYFEGRYLHQDGSYRWLGWTAAPFPAERLIYIFARDVTERKQNEDSIRTLNQELEKRVGELVDVNAELEAFNYSISHDLRAPLRSMQGFAAALVEDAGVQLNADCRLYAERIVRSANYMETLLQDLLNYSRLSRAELPLVNADLEAIAQEVLTNHSKILQERNALVEIKNPLASVRAHSPTLGQILANLVGNAVKFVAEGRQPQVRIWTELLPDSVRINVADNGIGIAAAHQEKIFGLFERLHTTANYPGTGIGLAIVRKATERMGGRVGVESAPGAGSRFWIELPSGISTAKAGSE